jgi:hypothetical protein
MGPAYLWGTKKPRLFQILSRYISIRKSIKSMRKSIRRRNLRIKSIKRRSTKKKSTRMRNLKMKLKGIKQMTPSHKSQNTKKMTLSPRRPRLTSPLKQR